MSSMTNEPGARLAEALADLPAKMRVHELAKRAGLSSKETIAALAAQGLVVGSAASSVPAQEAATLLSALLGAPAEEVPEAEAVTAEPVATEPPVAEQPAPAPAGKRAPRRSRAKTAIEPSTEPPSAEPPVIEPRAPESAAEPTGLFLEPEAAPRATRARRRKTAPAEPPPVEAEQPVSEQPALPDTPAAPETKPAPRSRRTRKPAAAQQQEQLTVDEGAGPAGEPVAAEPGEERPEAPATEDQAPATDDSRKGGRGRRRRGRPADQPAAEDTTTTAIVEEAPAEAALPEDAEEPAEETEGQDGESAGRRRRRRGRRGRGRVAESADGDEEAGDGGDAEEAEDEPADAQEPADTVEDGEEAEGNGRRRRRRRRRGGADEAGTREDDPDNTVVHVREARSAASEVQGVRGSTRLEAKRQRRRDSRESRRRPQILTEAEFLARREAVHRVMAVRQRDDLAQVALLEDGVLVEHFVSRAGSASMIGDIYLGRVQNVLPSMEAAFIDIGRGRNAVLYAGEVNWDAAGLAGKARRIETALSSGDMILVQVSKDPVGHKGARLTTQISLPGRFLVYVPGGGATGISRKLPDTERKRLKSILDRIVPEEAGVIIRTAAEGVAEDELAADVERLQAQWEEISSYAERARENKGNGSSSPQQLSREPDTLIKVVRDLFNSDISQLVIDGAEAYAAVAEYVNSVAPELADRLTAYLQPEGSKADVFSAYRIDEQIAKALERKVHLPSGGSLVIDRTEAMTVVDVNTGKYTGSGGNLEETVTKNNLEAAEEIVRQLRLRDIGGIIVVDFIDMVLESNRELVLRRLTECLGRDRTRHQVAEVTSLGLVQMTRKKMGTGLVEAFSEQCEHCHGRGIVLKDVPVDPAAGEDDAERRGRRRGRGRGTEQPAAPVAKVAVPVVRPPDPRGPRPPVRVTVEAPVVAAVPPETDPVDDTDQLAGRQADDAVAAVLAALDARLAEQAQQATKDAAAIVDRAAEPERTPEPATVDAATAEAADGAAPRRRRGRRAAGRPAGAPATDSGAVVVVAEAPPQPAPESPASPASVVIVADPAPKRRRRAASRPAGPAQGQAT